MQNKAYKCQILQNKIKCGNHGNNKNCIITDFDSCKENCEKILVFGKLFGTTLVSMATKSYDQLKFLNLVTMATNTIV